MFYSHDILTSRKYGVATIWLVATLGSKSTLKKVSRKAILDVDVRKACETILTPEAPLALRLQSNLLYGVTRVYSQQCGYVLNDVESARNNMRTLFNAVQAAGLEPEGAHQARTEQLVLQSDPNFLLDLDLAQHDVNDRLISVPILGASQQSFLSPHSTQDLGSSSQDIGGIIIPPSQSPSVGMSVGRMNNSRLPEDSGGGHRLQSARLLEDDLGLTIEPDGTVRMGDLPPSQPTRNSGVVEPQGTVGEAGSEHAVTEQGQAYAADDMPMQLDDGGDLFAPLDDNLLASDPADLDLPLPTQATVQGDVTSEEVQAPLRRRKRVPKHIPLDNDTELHISDLARWNANYISNMRSTSRQKDLSKLTTLAKDNALFWVLGPIHQPEAGGPLDIFTGVKLLEAFSGLKLFPGGQKRRYDEDEDEGFTESRRVRSRDEIPDDEMGRGIQDEMDREEDFIALMDEDTVEQGRNAPTPLDDRYLSNIFPWNQSAGSRRPSNLPSSGSLAAAGRNLSMIGRRGGRLTSASPLLGRGPLDGDEMDDIQFPDLAIPSTDDDFEMFGPLAHDDTQTTAQSEWRRAALDGDGLNFLAFVQSSIEEANKVHQQLAAGDEEIETHVDSIEFEKLLPPARNSFIVAAQALMHVLVLGTKGHLGVQQAELFGPIVVSVNAA